MPNKLHPAKWGPRDTTFDKYIQKLLAERGYGHEREYVGVTTQERADEVRKGMRSSGRHLGVSVKAFWRKCTGCPDGGDECRFHVSFTLYDPEVARAYKERLAQAANENK